MVFLVNPLDLIHAGHINGDNHPVLVEGKFQRLRDSSSATEWNQNYVVLVSTFDEVLAVLSRERVEDHINVFVKFSDSGLEHLLERLAVRVVQTLHFVERSAREVLLAKFFNEGVVSFGRINLQLERKVRLVLEVQAETGLQEGLQLRHDFPAIHVSVSFDSHLHELLINLKSRVSVAPAPEVVVIELGALALVVVNYGRVFFVVDLDFFLGNENLARWELVVDLIKPVHALVVSLIYYSS